MSASFGSCRPPCSRWSAVTLHAPCPSLGAVTGFRALSDDVEASDVGADASEPDGGSSIWVADAARARRRRRSRARESAGPRRRRRPATSTVFSSCVVESVPRNRLASASALSARARAAASATCSSVGGLLCRAAASSASQDWRRAKSCRECRRSALNLTRYEPIDSVASDIAVTLPRTQKDVYWRCAHLRDSRGCPIRLPHPKARFIQSIYCLI